MLIRRPGENLSYRDQQSRVYVWHIQFSIKESCTFPKNDVRPHYAFDNIVLLSEKFVASAPRVYPPNNEAVLSSLEISDLLSI